MAAGAARALPDDEPDAGAPAPDAAVAELVALALGTPEAETVPASGFAPVARDPRVTDEQAAVPRARARAKAGAPAARDDLVL